MEALQRARLSLEGLSVGDALGERFFGPSEQVRERIRKRELPAAPWRYTDDSEMGISVVQVLEQLGHIDCDAIAAAFAQRYDSTRGYGAAAHQLLQAYGRGVPWHVGAYALFDGSGSFGNGAAMRVAPVGAFFADDLEQAKQNATASAIVTHTHAEGVAGAVAVAVAAAMAWHAGEGEAPTALDFLRQVAEQVPASEVQDGILRGAELGFDASPPQAAARLGSGQRVAAQDTVPFALWCAAQHLGSYQEAFWCTVAGLGDRDTTCAIVGGIVALSDREIGVPAAWLEAREPLPFSVEDGAPSDS